MDDVIAAVPLFAGLPAVAQEALAGRLGRRTAARGEVVFDEGDKGDAMYVVLSGKVKIARGAGDGRENLLAVLGPGDLLGELALFDSAPRAAAAVAVVDSTLAVLDRGVFDAWLDEHPRAAVELLRVLAARLRQTNELMADLVFTDVPGRVAKTLLALGERFGRPEPDGLRVSHDLTQEELAQLVGASRETVNKALSDFASRGWLRLDGKSVVLLDRDRLVRRAR